MAPVMAINNSSGVLIVRVCVCERERERKAWVIHYCLEQSRKRRTNPLHRLATCLKQNIPTMEIHKKKSVVVHLSFVFENSIQNLSNKARSPVGFLLGPHLYNVIKHKTLFSITWYFEYVWQNAKRYTVVSDFI